MLVPPRLHDPRDAHDGARVAREFVQLFDDLVYLALVRQAFKLMYREHRKIAEIRSLLSEKADGALPIELMTMLNFVEWTAKGKNGRGREAFRNQPQPAAAETERRAA